ncbi:aminopeptidase C [Striga asiatica]|uniref:Aminopeptidase C n=1 Tax=Striga asiatica TaxID=4170 RepID=A0A5A7R693_STRAF|nr:aminopeptidase C [Striga asiatica]
MHKNSGISPERLFDDTSSTCRGEFLPRSLGKLPVSLFLNRLRSFKLGELAMLSGIIPSSRLSFKMSDSSGNSHSSSGISPVNSFMDASNLLNMVRLDQPIGKLPVNELLNSSICSICVMPVIILPVEIPKLSQPGKGRWDGAHELAGGEPQVFQVGQVAEVVGYGARGEWVVSQL